MEEAVFPLFKKIKSFVALLVYTYKCYKASLDHFNLEDTLPGGQKTDIKANSPQLGLATNYYYAPF